MKQFIKTRWLLRGCFCILNFAYCISTLAFEGRINAVLTRGNQTDTLLYTVGTDFVRVEMTTTNWPNPVDILDRNSGELTLLFPNNRSFVRLKPVTENSSAMPPGFPQMPAGLPPGVGPQSPPAGLPAMPNLPAPQGIGPTNLPGMPAPPPMPAMPNLPPGAGLQSAPGGPAMPAMPPRPVMPNMPALPPGVGPQPSAVPGISGMPAMPMMPGMTEKMELQATGQKTNLLGFACEQYEIKQRGETMEIWATDQLFPFQPYVQNQPHRFGPRMIEEQWPELVKAKKLFPLLATLKFDNGMERFRFEVQSITPEKLTAGDEQLFQPPTNYFEIQPLPF
ncbi:MAG: DUF4412 domain-containing protein [Verrucomicrobiia bacterium]